MTPRSPQQDAPSLRLTVLGASPAPTNPNGAGSGYLVRSSNERILVDCGPGVIGRLRAQVAVADLDAVVISHFHADHFIDLISLRYGLKYARWRPGPKLPLYVPPKGDRLLARLGQVLDGDPRFFEGEMALVEYEPGQELRIGAIGLRPLPVDHFVPSFAMAIAAGGRRLTYSADAAPCPTLLEAARGAHLFLCEATLASGAEEAKAGRRGHMGADEAGILAREAGVQRLLLTHLPTDGAAQRLQSAQQAFGPAVQLACEGHTYEV